MSVVMVSGDYCTCGLFFMHSNLALTHSNKFIWTFITLVVDRAARRDGQWSNVHSRGPHWPLRSTHAPGGPVLCLFKTWSLKRKQYSLKCENHMRGLPWRTSSMLGRGLASLPLCPRFFLFFFYRHYVLFWLKLLPLGPRTSLYGSPLRKKT